MICSTSVIIAHLSGIYYWLLMRLVLTGLWFEGQKYFALYLDKEHEEKEIPIFEKVKEWLTIYFSGKSRTLLYRFILQEQTFKMKYGKSFVPFHTAIR